MEVLKLVDFQDTKFIYAVASIIAAPLIWNILARLEFYTHILTKLAFGNKYWGCYVLAVYIFSFSLFRDHLILQAVQHQAKWIGLNDNVALLGYVFMGMGQLFALTSLYKLGVTGTYLGDYFGIYMNERVTSFPFNTVEHPMYYGSTLTFLGTSFVYKSPVGLVLTGVIFIMYLIAIQIEGPFTTYIYTEVKGKKK